MHFVVTNCSTSSWWSRANLRIGAKGAIKSVCLAFGWCLGALPTDVVAKVLRLLGLLAAEKDKPHLAALQEINLIEREALQLSRFAAKQGYRCCMLPHLLGWMPWAKNFKRGAHFGKKRRSCHTPDLWLY